jgi:type I restriction enzyme M protein
MKTYEHLTLYLERDRLKLLNMRKDIQQKLKSLPELLTISQVAEIFSIHPDTLRNWEKDGTLVPLRVGKRGDRKYRPQDIEAITDKMGSKLTLPQLESFLWKSADILRGKIDSSDYKKYIFGLLFYKRMSDVWDEEYNSVLEMFKDDNSKIMLARADYNHRFQVPKDCRWDKITEHAENIGQKLNEIFDKLTNANSPKLDKIFEDLDFANKDRFPNETLQRLINHFSQYNFGDTYISSDLLGDAYEYLIKQFAADAGKKGGEFYTPREVEKVIMGIVKPHQKDHIYDPTVGSAGFLLEAYDYLKQKSGEKIARTLYLYGQEQNLATFAIARINMFLHGLDSADIRRGDTLANPQFLNQQGNLQTFDIVVANPPYSIKDWEYEAFKNRFGRLDGYDAPPDKNADYAFVLHIIKSMNQNGRAGVVLPHGVLFRGGAEARIREQILKNDLIETIISLPSKLFYGTGIPAIILILNKNKPEEKKNKVLIIDAEKDYLEGKNQNSLRPQDINKIVKAHDNYQDIEKYARVISLKEIQDNDYNLNIRQYIDSSEKEEIINVKGVRKEIQTIKKELAEVDQQVEKYLDELNY